MAIILKLCALSFTLAMLVFCVWAVRRALTERKIMQGIQKGQAIDAEVVRSGKLSSGRSNAYYVAYQYRIDEKHYAGEQPISDNYYRSLKSSVKIKYLAQTPQISRIADDTDRDPIKAVTFVAVLAAIVLLCSLFLSTAIFLGTS